MATSGDDETKNSASADEEKGDENFCSPCHSDGTRIVAVGYCVNCKEWLCVKCFEGHRLPTLMRKHVLLDREEMTKDVSARGSNKCPNHDNEPIRYHCKVHSFLGCHMCSHKHQKSCKDVKLIPEVSETFSGSEEFQNYMSKLEVIAERSNDLLDEVRRNIKSTDTSHSEAIAAFKNFKTQILNAIDNLEKDLLEKAESVTKAQTAKLNEVVNKIMTVQEANQVLANEIEVLQNKHLHNDMYIAVARRGDKLLSLENELIAIESDKNVKCLRFEDNSNLVETLKSPWGLGQFVTKSTIDKVEFVADINVKFTDDTNDCDVFGSVLMPDGKLVAADTRNANVKLINTRQLKLISTLKLSNGPRYVAKVTDNTVAVTIPDDKKIVFVRTDPSLSVDRELAVNGRCWGVAYKDGKLMVTFTSPHKVELMDLQGTVLLSIDTDTIGRQLFYDPLHVTINPDHDVMYVSNYSGHNVVCLRFDGSVVATYKDSELQRPCQAVVDSTGMVYVCADGSNTLTQMTPNCKKVKILLTSSDGLRNPRSISYDESASKLYIGGYMNSVKVYRFQFSTL